MTTSRFAVDQPYADGPRLLADIGGTNARFVLETAPGVQAALAVMPCRDWPTLEAAVRAYLDSAEAQAAGSANVRHAALALANPVDGDQVRLTNHDWAFSIEAMRHALGWFTLLVINDFTALAMALPHLPAGQKRQIGPGQARSDSVIGLLGAGTGLGVSGMIPADDRWIALGSEGGHASFAPRDKREMAILDYAMQRYTHVSTERLLSGPGLELMYLALAHMQGRQEAPLSAEQVSARALQGDSLCQDVVQTFCAMLGTVAGNVALTLGALGGIYIGGGIVPHFGRLFDDSLFRQRFEDKGRFTDYMRQIPTFLITGDNPGFIGVSAVLAEKLGAKAGSTPILDAIAQARQRMSPSECKVADWVLQDPRAVLSSPIGEIARQAGVSQPTVMRFCRSLNLQGLAEFKLKLAAGLTGTIAIAHSQIRFGDSTAEVSDKVLANSAHAAMSLRDTINPRQLNAALELLQHAQHIEILCVGSARLVAEDALQKFLHLGLRTSYFPDLQNQLMSARLLRAGDVALAISRSGQLEELLQAARAARARGGQLIAICPHGSPLARLADVCLHLDHAEGDLHYIPMVVRLLQLIMVDILAIGLARNLQQGNGEEGAAAKQARQERKLGAHLE
ncbi:glucokinase [Massilia sp. W12]|uniref:glucokinase n=1 Tax=Massilia sp. W12 TaxID=3126507 RepID=UPI0030D13974